MQKKLATLHVYVSPSHILSYDFSDLYFQKCGFYLEKLFKQLKEKTQSPKKLKWFLKTLFNMIDNNSFCWSMILKLKMV